MANPNEVYCGNCSSIGSGMHESDVYVMLSRYPMRCIKTGATQLDENGDNVMQNVDVFECEFCHYKVIKR